MAGKKSGFILRIAAAFFQIYGVSRDLVKPPMIYREHALVKARKKEFRLRKFNSLVPCRCGKASFEGREERGGTTKPQRVRRGGSFEKEKLSGLPSPCWLLDSQLDRQKIESPEGEILFLPRQCGKESFIGRCFREVWC